MAEASKAELSPERKDDIESMMQAFDAGFADEIKAKMDRLDRLIGGDHWLSVGAYKERLIREQLVQYVPKRYEVGTGFLMANVDGQRVLSRQIDLLIWDSSRHSPFFRDGEFVILPPEACRAAIEVKGHVNKQQLVEGITNLLSVSRLANLVWHKSQAWFHTFLFALDTYDNLTFPEKVLDGIHEALLKAPYVVTEGSDGEFVVQQFDFTMEDRHKNGDGGGLASASLYWPGTIALLGGGIIRFSRFNVGQPMSGYACVYRASAERDLTLGIFRHELIRVLQAENRAFAEKTYDGFVKSTDLVMPLPYSLESKAVIQDKIKELAVYEPQPPWEWTRDDALGAAEKKKERKKKASSESTESRK